MKLKSKIIGLLLITGFILPLGGCKKEDNNSKINQTNGLTTAIFGPVLPYEPMTDQDGNIYNTIIIGYQTWMAENLRVTHYRNGDEIPEVRSDAAWSGLFTGAYCNANNAATLADIATFGRLYNWYAVNDSRNIAPAGWHVATDADWTTLINLAGGHSFAGGRLKETGTTHWFSPNTDASNQFGFTALPSTIRDSNGGFLNLLGNGWWWSNTEINVRSAWTRTIYYSTPDVDRYGYYKEFGISVRCVKD